MGGTSNKVRKRWEYDIKYSDHWWTRSGNVVDEFFLRRTMSAMGSFLRRLGSRGTANAVVDLVGWNL